MPKGRARGVVGPGGEVYASGHAASRAHGVQESTIWRRCEKGIMGWRWARDGEVVPAREPPARRRTAAGIPRQAATPTPKRSFAVRPPPSLPSLDRASPDVRRAILAARARVEVAPGGPP